MEYMIKFLVAYICEKKEWQGKKKFCIYSVQVLWSLLYIVGKDEVFQIENWFVCKNFELLLCCLPKSIVKGKNSSAFLELSPFPMVYRDFFYGMLLWSPISTMIPHGFFLTCGVGCFQTEVLCLSVALQYLHLLLLCLSLTFIFFILFNWTLY